MPLLHSQMGPPHRRAPLIGTLIAVLTWAGCYRPNAGDPVRERFRFPAGFLWGTSTAGFQVEPGCPTLPEDECVDRGSDWYQWVTDPELVAERGTFLSGEPLSHAPGHYELFDQDFRLAADELGTNAFRMSLEWSRIFPRATDDLETVEDMAAAADPAAVAHYHEVFASLRSHGIRPLVTLNHYTLPLWLHDGKACHQDLSSCPAKGWVDRERAVREFAKYAAFCAREFGGEVDLWATLNEPFALLLAGYVAPSADRTNPPGLSQAWEAARSAMVAMIEAHARAYDAVHENDRSDADGDGEACQVGLVYNVTAVLPRNPDSEEDQQAAVNVDYLYNRSFLNAVVLGLLDEDLDGEAVYRQDLDGRMDYIGINYYMGIEVQGTSWPTLPELSPLSTFDPFTIILLTWYPRGLYQSVLEVSSYGLPIIVTECGVSDPDDDGTSGDFLTEHLIWLSRAIRDGADVRGFFYWSLMDNYEWNQGTSMRFGLFAVDPLDPTKERRPKRSVAIYHAIIERNEVPQELALPLLEEAETRRW